MKRLLVVDDDIIIREMIETALRGKYEVRSLPFGEEVPSLIDSYQPHLLLLDINLPGTDGFTLSEAVRRATTRLRLPILFMTVRNDAPAFIAALASGDDSVITKPFEITTLKNRIEKSLRPAAN